MTMHLPSHGFGGDGLISSYGPVELAGGVDVRFADGYAPQWGHFFNLVTFETLSGDFDTIILPELPHELRWDRVERQHEMQIHIRHIADFTGDGVVGANDLSLLLSHWGTSDPIFNLSGDGIVDARDLALFFSYWGANAASYNRAIPSPASTTLFGFALVVWARRRRA